MEPNFVKSIADDLVHESSAHALIVEVIEELKRRRSEQNSYAYWDITTKEYLGYLKTIHQFSGSESESKFLGSILLCSLMSNPELLRVTEPFEDAYIGRKRETRLIELCHRLGDWYSHEQRELAEEKILMGRFEQEEDWSSYDYLTSFETFIQYSADTGNISKDDARTILSDLDRFDIASEVVFYLTPQVRFPDILVNGKSIRCDILIWNPLLERFNMVIECDGYQYHCSKESFENDRIRDRKLKYKGFSTLRYSGSEIWKDPLTCAMDLMKHILLDNFNNFEVKSTFEKIASR